jgi:ketosteroid isomerase-like protein
MNFRFLSTMLFTCAAFFFPSCAPKPVVDENAVFSSIKDNLKAMQNKDLEGVMATIHPDSPSFGSTREVLLDLFKKYDLRFTITDLKIISATPEEVKVSFVQETERLKGPEDLQSSRCKGVHTLRKDHGKWKIYNTNSGRAEPLHPTS